MHLFEPHTFEWENCWEFQTTSPLKPLCQICSNFMWSLLRLGEEKITEMVAVRWPRWPPCPYMVKKPLKIDCSRTEDAFGLNICTNHRAQEIYLSCWNACRTLTFDLFTSRSCLLPCAFVWAPYICMGQLLRISNNFSSEAAEPNLLKISYGASVSQRNERFLKW